MSGLWFAWLLSTVMAAVYGLLWVRTLHRLTDAEIERDEAVDRWLFAAPTSYRLVPTTRPPALCDHLGIDHGPFSHLGVCPSCRKCKFIGHGPLCGDCYAAS